MIGLSVKVEGADEGARQIAAIKGALPQEAKEGLRLEAAPLYFALADYPPELPGQVYVRTYNYRDQIDVDVEMIGGDAVLKAELGADYSVFLRGDPDTGARQAAIHTGRWETLEAIAARLVPVVVAHIRERIDRLIRRYTGGR